MNKQNKIIIGLLAFVLTLTVGYAIFSVGLNITGTAEASGEFKLIFSSVGEIKEVGSTGATANISTDGKTLSVDVPALEYPSAYVNIPVTIKNEGTIDAILKKISEKNISNEDIKVTYTGVKQNEVIRANNEVDVVIKVTWLEESVKTASDLTFEIILEYEQATNLADSGATGGSSSESDWTFKTNESGVITAYNYEKGTDVKLPAEIDGVAVTTINESSFKEGNLTAYIDENEGKMYMLIDEEEPNFTIVKDKVVNLMILSNECTEDDTDCISQIKQRIYICKDKNTCYNLKDKEDGNESNVSIPQAAMEAGEEKMLVDTDPNTSLEESFNEPSANITSLDLSEATNLTTIEEHALADAGLQSVNFGENSNIKTIGTSAFSNNQISELTIPKSVETIENSAFYGNQISSLTFEGEEKVALNNDSIKASYLNSKDDYEINKLNTNASGSKLKTIGNSAFSNNQISELTIPKSVVTIDNYAFNSNQITSVIIPKNITRIGNSAFRGNQINSLTFEENSSLQTIEFYAFEGNKILSLNIPSSVTSVESWAFDNNQINNLVIPKTVTSYTSSSFSNNPIETLYIGHCEYNICTNNIFGTSIKTLTVESGDIGSNAFKATDASTNKIQTLTLGKDVKSIGYYAFYGNELTSVTMQEGITSIGTSAFSNNKITNLRLPASLTSVSSSAFTDNVIDTLYIGNCASGMCKLSYFGNNVKNLTIESGDIPSNAFSQSDTATTKIETLTLGNNITSIGKKAFYNNNITDLTIGKCTTDICGLNITDISDLTFGMNVKSLTVNSGNIGALFFGTIANENLTSLTLGEGVVSIGASAFYSAPITKVVIPSTVKTIEEYAFNYTELTNVVFKSNSDDLTIGNNAFSSADITSLTFEEGTTKITGDFSNNQITELEIPKSVKKIDAVFSGNQISELTIPNSVTKIGSAAFKSNQISSLTFEENSNLKTIGEYAFGNNQISTLTIPKSVTSIENYAFTDNSLTSILIKRTEEDFLANVTVGSNWYSGSPTITYEP